MKVLSAAGTVRLFAERHQLRINHVHAVRIAIVGLVHCVVTVVLFGFVLGLVARAGRTRAALVFLTKNGVVQRLLLTAFLGHRVDALAKVFRLVYHLCSVGATPLSIFPSFHGNPYLGTRVYCSSLSFSSSLSTLICLASFQYRVL